MRAAIPRCVNCSPAKRKPVVKHQAENDIRRNVLSEVTTLERLTGRVSRRTSEKREENEGGKIESWYSYAIACHERLHPS